MQKVLVFTLIIPLLSGCPYQNTAHSDDRWVIGENGGGGDSGGDPTGGGEDGGSSGGEGSSGGGSGGTL